MEGTKQVPVEALGQVLGLAEQALPIDHSHIAHRRSEARLGRLGEPETVRKQGARQPAATQKQEQKEQPTRRTSAAPDAGRSP